MNRRPRFGARSGPEGILYGSAVAPAAWLPAFAAEPDDEGLVSVLVSTATGAGSWNGAVR